MTESPGRLGNGRATIKVRFTNLHPLQRICEEQISTGSLLIESGESLPTGYAVDVVFSVADLDAVLRVAGKILPRPPSDARRILYIGLDDPAAAGQAAQSYLAFAGSILEDLTAVAPQAPPAGTPERRESARAPSRLRVRVRFEDAKQFSLLYTKDISTGGMFVASKEPKPPGSPVEVVLHPPGLAAGITLSGVVSHVVYPTGDPSARSGMGIRFDPLTAEQSAIIEGYLRAFAGPAPTSGAEPFSLSPVPQEERREEIRVQARLQLKLRPVGFLRFRELFTKDLSRSGLFVCADDPHPPGTKVEILLYAMGNLEPLPLHGEVVRCIPPALAVPGETPGMGIHFEGVSEPARDLLGQVLNQALVAARSPPPAAPEEASVTPPPMTPYVPLPPLAAPIEPPPTLSAAANPFAADAEPPPWEPPPTRMAAAAAPHLRPVVSPVSAAQPARAAPVAAQPADTVAHAAGRVSSMVELRRDPWDAAKIQALLHFASLDDFREAYARDISRGGVFLRTEEQQPLRSQLEVVLLPPGAHEGISLMGEVVHIIPRDRNRPEVEPGMGIQFLDMTLAKKAAMQACLSALATDPAHPGAEPIPLVQEVSTPPKKPEPFTPVRRPAVSPRPAAPEEGDLDRQLDEAFMDEPGKPIDFDKLEIETVDAGAHKGPNFPRRR
jgi:uncharacterized protein (TIGR02266 family)